MRVEIWVEAAEVLLGVVWGFLVAGGTFVRVINKHASVFKSDQSCDVENANAYFGCPAWTPTLLERPAWTRRPVATIALLWSILTIDSQNIGLRESGKKWGISPQVKSRLCTALTAKISENMKVIKITYLLVMMMFYSHFEGLQELSLVVVCLLEEVR